MIEFCGDQDKLQIENNIEYLYCIWNLYAKKKRDLKKKAIEFYVTNKSSFKHERKFHELGNTAIDIESKDIINELGSISRILKQ